MIQNGHLFRNHCWRELGLGMIANNPNVTCAERMAFSRHSNASSHIAYIRSGHNSDFAFQKAVSGAPMPTKKIILSEQALKTKLMKSTKAKGKKAPIKKKSPPLKPKKARKVIQKVVRKATTPLKAPTSMKSPPSTRLGVRRSSRAQKAK